MKIYRLALVLGLLAFLPRSAGAVAPSTPSFTSFLVHDEVGRRLADSLGVASSIATGDTTKLRNLINLLVADTTLVRTLRDAQLPTRTLLYGNALGAAASEMDTCRNYNGLSISWNFAPTLYLYGTGIGNGIDTLTAAYLTNNGAYSDVFTDLDSLKVIAGGSGCTYSVVFKGK